MLSWAELRKVSEEGGKLPDTANHVIMTRIPVSQAENEICSSAAILKEELDRPVRLFAYPNGKLSDDNASIQKILHGKL